MVEEKKMDQTAFGNILKEFNALGELIGARQESKQAVMDEFDSTSKRFLLGKISERTLATSVKKTNKELDGIDDEIKKAIQQAVVSAAKAKKFVLAQSPKNFNASLSGMVKAGSRKKKISHKRRKFLR